MVCFTREWSVLRAYAATEIDSWQQLIDIYARGASTRMRQRLQSVHVQIVLSHCSYRPFLCAPRPADHATPRTLLSTWLIPRKSRRAASVDVMAPRSLMVTPRKTAGVSSGKKNDAARGRRALTKETPKHGKGRRQPRTGIVTSSSCAFYEVSSRRNPNCPASSAARPLAICGSQTGAARKLVHE